MWEAMAPRKAECVQPAAGPFGFKASRSLVPHRVFCCFNRGSGEGGGGASWDFEKWPLNRDWPLNRGTK